MKWWKALHIWRFFGKCKRKRNPSGLLSGHLAPWPPPLVSLLSELVADEMLLGHLGLLVDLSQHLMHHVEQRTAQAQQLKQQHIVMRVAPYVRPHSWERLTHTSQQLLRQHTHSPASTPRQAQASPKQGNQGTWGLQLGAARGGGGVAPAVHGRGCDTTLGFLYKNNTQRKNSETQHTLLKQQQGTFQQEDLDNHTSLLH